MAIATLQQLIDGLQPIEEATKTGVTAEAAAVLQSLWYAAGRPAAAAAPAPGLAGAALTSDAGQIPFRNPAGGSNAYLAKLACNQVILGPIFLADRLWHNSGLDVTLATVQAVNSVAWPARDQDGSTGGNGVMVGIEVRTATTNAAAVLNATLDYTNSAGTPGRTGTILPTTGIPATAVAGTFIPFMLAAGDAGIRSIQNITLGTSLGAGAIHLVAYRVIAMAGGEFILSPFGLTPLAEFDRDPVSLGLPRLYNNTVPFFLRLAAAVTASAAYYRFQLAHG